MVVVSPPRNHKAKLEGICLQKSYCAPPHRRGKRNWLWQRQPGDCPVAGIRFFFIQSRLKIAILLIKTHVSKSFMLQSKTKRNWNDQRLFQGLISLCALCLQSTCKHNRNHRTECVQHRARAQTLPKKCKICNIKRKCSVFVLHLIDCHNGHLAACRHYYTEIFKNKRHKRVFCTAEILKTVFSLVLIVYVVYVY